MEYAAGVCWRESCICTSSGLGRSLHVLVRLSSTEKLDQSWKLSGNRQKQLLEQTQSNIHNDFQPETTPMGHDFGDLIGVWFRAMGCLLLGCNIVHIMFVTKHGLNDACNIVGKQLDQISENVDVVRQPLLLHLVKVLLRN